VPRYRQLGNAVTVPVAAWIARRILKATPSGGGEHDTAAVEHEVMHEDSQGQ
jgi:hypothetical protein